MSAGDFGPLSPAVGAPGVYNRVLGLGVMHREHAAVGVSHVDAERAWLGWASLQPTFHGKGTQSALIRACLENALAAECCIICSNTDTELPHRPIPTYRALFRQGCETAAPVRPTGWHARPESRSEAEPVRADIVRDRMDLSCILLTWNSAAYAETCLRSVFADLEASGLRHELIVIDNGSTDGTLQVLSRLARPSLTVIPLGRNTGTTFSRNIGLRMACGEFVAILDSDIEIHAPGTFLRVLAFLREHPDVGIAAPQLRFPSGRYQKTVDVFPTVTHKARRFLHLRAMEDAEGRDGAAADLPRDVDYAVSAFWMLPRALTARAGLLDERIFYAPEDVDYCLRAALVGYRVVYLPAIVAIHHAQEIGRRNLLGRSFREHLKGLAYFWHKHSFVFGLAKVYRRIAAARATARGEA